MSKGSSNDPHFLGSFYSTVTQYLGYSPNADEYKVMGLAAYGVPRYYPQLRNLIELRPDGQFRLNLDYFVRHWGQPVWYSRRFVELFGPPRTSEDIGGDTLVEEESTHVVVGWHGSY